MTLATVTSVDVAMTVHNETVYAAVRADRERLYGACDDRQDDTATGPNAKAPISIGNVGWVIFEVRVPTGKMDNDQVQRAHGNRNEKSHDNDVFGL
jgi:hypothetical protein